MASSSSSSSQFPKKYDVFISFRGEDTRDNFISHLHDALSRNQIETYIDYRLQKGDEVWPSLVKAIEDSMLFLIVFSENYASSSWCLNELTKILEECSNKEEGRLAIPVFYKVDPSHIRKQSGSYEVAFIKHQQNQHKEQLQKWRNALTQASNLSGWDSAKYRTEVEFIGEIIKGVLTKLDLMDQSVHLDGLIGIHEKIAHIESLMCNESQDVRFIGIWGMGGIGKTTIARALFNKLCFSFQSSCFLADVREETEKYGIVHLKNKLLSSLLNGEESFYKGMPDGASTYARRRLSRKKVLIVLDDVNDSEQMMNLVGSHHWFGYGSRVIITTRDKQVFGKNVDDIYEVEALEFGEALHLFNLNAFKNKCLEEEFKELSQKVVDYAQCIPLALIVLGSFLYGKSKEEWKSQLKKLKDMPYPKIHKILKLSYEGLDYEEKNIFLDVACFFKGRQVGSVRSLLDACGYSMAIGLKSLQDKALVAVSCGKVSMHDLIQEMGLEIVREESKKDPGKRSRLWDSKDIYQVLNYNKGSESIEGISLDMSKIKELHLSSEVFAKMQDLRFLEFYYSSYSKKQVIHLPQGLEYLSDKLIYLRWDNYPSKYLPSTFSAENLVELIMPHSGMKKLWHGVQNVVNLRLINLRDSVHLMELPNLSKAKSLENVNLSKCASLSKVHPSILTLEKLKSLDLGHCVSLTSLKSDLHLKTLAHLSLDHCSNLKEFSVTSENMKVLKLEGTAIHELPSSIGQQFKLEELYLNDCRNLKNVQSNLFNGLQSLKELQLNDCCNIFEVIDQISTLSSLNNLSIEGITVESLPSSIKQFSNLQYLKLNKCTRLQSLPQLPQSLISLDAIDCSSLKKVQYTFGDVKPLNGGKRYSFTSFLNCMELDEHSVKVILANVLLLLNKLILERNSCYYLYHYYVAEVKYPGRKVPEWFRYRSTQASITIDLSSAPLYMDWGLVFCFICFPSPMKELDSIQCYGHLQIITDQSVDEAEAEAIIADDRDKKNLIKTFYFRKDVDNLTSDHVFLWYDDDLSYKLQHEVKKSGAAKSKIFFKLKIVPQFGHVRRSRKHFEVIKECGVCPTYSLKFQNFIHELELESEASASGMGVGCSYQSKHEEEAMPPMQKSKGFIFSPFPTTSWKNGTQGFKDLFNL